MPRTATSTATRGGALTLSAAACLDRWSDAAALLPTSRPGERQFALVLAALNGNAAAVRWLLDRGADPNAASADLYPHGTPLHHAVSSGNLETVRVLVENGANLTSQDTAWRGTPLGWAYHYIDLHPRPAGAFEEIAR